MVELIWDGKYDDAGKRVAPVRVSLPFQTTETVNETQLERQQAFEVFTEDQPANWRNRLIWGDKKFVLPALRSDYSEAIDLIYIDPFKDRAARAWRENATVLGDVTWTYVKVPQVEFDKLEPSDLEDVVTVFGAA